MGEAKRRKFSDPNYGKIPKIRKNIIGSTEKHNNINKDISANEIDESTDIFISRPLQVPSLSIDLLTKISDNEPDLITRHIEAKFFSAAKKAISELIL